MLQIDYITYCTTVSKCYLHLSFLLFYYRATAMLSVVYAVLVCLCVCVCLSVTLRYCVKTAKRSTQITPHDSPLTLVFLTPKFIAKFEREQPLRGRQMQVGWVKIRHFRRKRAITRKRYKIEA